LEGSTKKWAAALHKITFVLKNVQDGGLGSRSLNQVGFKCFPYLGMSNIFFEKSTTVVDEVGGLKWLIYGPPTLLIGFILQSKLVTCLKILRSFEIVQHIKNNKK